MRDFGCCGHGRRTGKSRLIDLLSGRDVQNIAGTSGTVSILKRMLLDSVRPWEHCGAQFELSC